MIQDEIDGRVKPLLERGESVKWRGVSSPTAFTLRRIPQILLILGFMLFPLASNGRSFRAILDFDVSSLNGFQIIWIAILAIPLVGILIATYRDLDVRWAITDKRIYRITRSTVTVTAISKAVSLQIRHRRDKRGSLVVNLPEYRDDDNHLHTPTIDLVSIDDVNGAHLAMANAMKQSGRARNGEKR